MPKSEVWRPIPKFETYYEASNMGRIRSKDRIVKQKHPTGKTVLITYKGKILKGGVGLGGYIVQVLSIRGKKFTTTTHALVLRTFVGERPIGKETRHKNGKPWINRLSNLEYATHLENSRDRRKHKTLPCNDRHYAAKLTNRQVVKIYKSKKSPKDLAITFNVSPDIIRRIKNRKRWKILTERLN